MERQPQKSRNSRRIRGRMINFKPSVKMVAQDGVEKRELAAQ